MDTSFDVGVTGVPVGGEGCAAPTGTRSSPADPSFGLALAGALDGATLAAARPQCQAGAAAAFRQDEGTPTPPESGVPEAGQKAAPGSWTIGDVLAMVRAALAAGKRPGPTGADLTATGVNGLTLDPEVPSQIRQGTATADTPHGTAAASTDPDEPIRANAHLKEDQIPIAAAVPVDLRPEVVTPWMPAPAAHDPSTDDRGVDGQASTRWGQTVGVEGAGGTDVAGRASAVSSDGTPPATAAPVPATAVLASMTAVLAPMTAAPVPITVSPAPARTAAALATTAPGLPTTMPELATATPGLATTTMLDVAAFAAPQDVAWDDANRLAGIAQESVPGHLDVPSAVATDAADGSQINPVAGDNVNRFVANTPVSRPGMGHDPMGELVRASAGRIGSSLPDVPPTSTGLPLPSVVGSSAGNSEALAADIRRSLARFLSADVRQSAAKLPTAGNDTRMVTGSLAPVAGSGAAAALPQGVQQEASQSDVAKAGAMAFQLASQDPIESPIWAANELAKVARWSPDILQDVQMTMTATSHPGSDANLDWSGDRNSRRDGSAPPAQPFGLAFGVGASGGVGSALASALSSPTNILPGATTDEPATESGSLTQSIVRVMKLQFTQGGGEVQLRLRPEHLGELTVALKVEAGAVSATLRSDSPIVRAWIEQHQQDLRTGLRESGLTLERLSVDPDGRSNDERQRDLYAPERQGLLKRRIQTTQFEALI